MRLKTAWFRGAYCAKSRPCQKKSPFFCKSVSRVNELPIITAIALKNSTADVLDQVAAGQAVTITRHDKPCAVLVPLDQYREVRQSQQAILQDLVAEYQSMPEEMQKPEQKGAAGHCRRDASAPVDSRTNPGPMIFPAQDGRF